MFYGEVINLRKRRTKYVRITVLALVLILAIFGFDFLIRSTMRKNSDGGNGGLVITSNREGQDPDVPVDIAVPEVTEPSADDSSYEKSEINENEYRKIFKSGADLGLGELVLINSENSYKFPDISALLVKMAANMQDKTYKLSYNTHQVQKAVMEPFNNMLNDFYRIYSTRDVTVVSSLVSYAEQNEMYKAPADPSLIMNDTQLSPGYSEHHSGYAVDFKLVSDSGKISEFDGTGNFKWLVDNCYKYGFIIRYPEGKEEVTGVKACPSHFRYVGVPHSYIMHDNGITLEEYMTELQKYIFGYDHLEYSVFGYDYEVYFVPAEESGETTVPVPANESYTVSGNNKDGFIVTVCRASASGSDSSSEDIPAETTAAVTSAVASVSGED
ncbi:MAG: M15 family metallopeptidase [Oscillospiraceae bacterium]|nr:M15 family metallopeptidase [Oscillospiraceae bacterium]